jgi:hypothetical protein
MYIISTHKREDRDKMKNVLSLIQFIKEIRNEQVVYALIPINSKIRKDKDDNSPKKIYSVVT